MEFLNSHVISYDIIGYVSSVLCILPMISISCCSRPICLFKYCVTILLLHTFKYTALYIEQYQNSNLFFSESFTLLNRTNSFLPVSIMETIIDTTYKPDEDRSHKSFSSHGIVCTVSVRVANGRMRFMCVMCVSRVECILQLP